jgi:hypothetical protein
MEIAVTIQAQPGIEEQVDWRSCGRSGEDVPCT